MPLAITVEPIAAVWDEWLPLAAEHWQEVSWQPGTREDLDKDLYQASEEAGSFIMFTARNDDVLVGYASFYVGRSAHRKGRIDAIQDAIYLMPAFRGHAAQLIAAADRLLADRGVSSVAHSVRNARNFGPVLERMGYRPIETVYARELMK
jgi:GNAT superfamily N-acetyltransferase